MPKHNKKNGDIFAILTPEMCAVKGATDFQVTETFHNRPICGSFAWIKQTLDPGASYIVFENTLTREGGSLFDPGLSAYAYFEASGYTWKMVMDKALQKEYLVVCIGTGNEEEVLGRVMGYGFPKDTVYYLYKAKEA
jgi:hypothetical protein